LIFVKFNLGVLPRLVFIILSFSIWIPKHYLTAAEKPQMERIFSIRATNDSLRDVLIKIAKASGYEIRFNTQLADENITIRLDRVNLNEALDRVLQPYNHMALWDDANGIVTILIFKKDTPPALLSGVSRIFELATETTSGP